MAKVRAAYNYSYNYEGKKISFKKDEEFQLLTKSNKDWWQVRRWMEGSAQDIYVPAVYVKEVEEDVVVKKEEDPTYMNLSDLKVKGPAENGTSTGGGTDLPTILNKPKKRSSVKRNPSMEGNKEKPVIENKDAGESSEGSWKTNGLNAGRPVSPSMLRRLNQGKPSGVGASQQPPQPQGPGSLKRGENLAPPPVQTKPRSKTDTSAPDPTSLTRQTSNPKSKVPPPVQTKPRPQKATAPRPVSCVAPGSEVERAAQGETGEVGEGERKQIVSALSNVLMKKNPHLANEHKLLGKTASSGAAESMSKIVTSEGLSKSLDFRLANSSQDARQIKPVEGPAITAPPPPTSPPSLPAGWTEHKTSSGQTYYYNSASGQSSWVRPQAESSTTSENSHLEKVAPRGWTKEINPITRTPVYTNSRTGERWALGSDAKGNYFYYNMVNSSLTVGELPEVSDPDENLYDSLLPAPSKPQSTTPTSSPMHSAGRSMSTPNVITDTIASSLVDNLKNHGYLYRKRLFDSSGKKAKEKSWVKHFVTLHGYELLFYPDLRAKDSGQKPSYVFCLLQTTVSPYNKDKKKSNVFQVSSHLGEQFLLQAETSNLMNEWYSKIQSAIDQANHDFKENPEKFKSVLVEPLMDDSEGSPKLSSNFQRGNKRSIRASRNTSQSDELLEYEDDAIDDMEISAAERSGHIRGRLRKLMARRPEKDTLKSKGILEDPVFGCELSALCERESGTVPKFFVQFMQHIEKVGLDVVGIYRLSGNAASINKLRYLVEQDQQIDLDSPEWSDVNIVTGCLKLYLRELPDPLIPFRLYKSFIEAARAPSQPQRIQQIVNRVKELPNANYCTLKALIQHLRRVVEKGSVNKMQATNVAIVFGPTVMRAETDSLEMATLMPVQNGIVEIMVNEFDTVFRK